MRIYVSEKDLEEYKLNEYPDDDEGIIQAIAFNCDRPSVQSLEQHDKELLQEFADKLYNDLNTLTRHGYTDDQWEEDCISKGDVEDLIKKLLKKRGVE